MTWFSSITAVSYTPWSVLSSLTKSAHSTNATLQLRTSPPDRLQRISRNMHEWKFGWRLVRHIYLFNANVKIQWIQTKTKVLIQMRSVRLWERLCFRIRCKWNLPSLLPGQTYQNTLQLFWQGEPRDLCSWDLGPRANLHTVNERQSWGLAPKAPLLDRLVWCLNLENQNVQVSADSRFFRDHSTK